MKLWWLKLYTIPSLKKLGWPMGSWLFANILCATFFPRIREMTYLVAIYPWFVFFNDNENTISNNLDFHRMHMNYRELQKGLFLDIVIQVTTFFGAFLISSFFPWSFRGPEKHQEMLDLLGTPALAIPLLSLGVLLVFAMKLGKVKRLHDRSRKGNGLKGDVSGVVFLLTVLIGIYLASFYEVGFYFGAFVFFGAISVIGLLNIFIEEFHLFSRIRRMSQFIEFPIALGLVFYLMAARAPEAIQEISDTGYSNMRRFQTFGMYKSFGLSLDPETVSEFLAVSPYKKMIFDHAEAYVFEMDVNELIKEPDFESYYFYLRSGKVSQHNLKTLFEKSKSHGGVWKSGQFQVPFQTALAEFYLARGLAAEQKGHK